MGLFYRNVDQVLQIQNVLYRFLKVSTDLHKHIKNVSEVWSPNKKHFSAGKGTFQWSTCWKFHQNPGIYSKSIKITTFHFGTLEWVVDTINAFCRYLNVSTHFPEHTEKYFSGIGMFMKKISGQASQLFYGQKVENLIKILELVQNPRKSKIFTLGL